MSHRDWSGSHLVQWATLLPAGVQPGRATVDELEAAGWERLESDAVYTDSVLMRRRVTP